MTKMAIVWGTNGNDSGPNALKGSIFDDYILGLQGHDELFGYGGKDRLWGDDGNDFLSGGSGDDYLNGGLHNDFLVGGSGADTMDGHNGVDTVSYEISSAGVYVDLQYGTGQYTWGGDAMGDRIYNVEHFILSQHNDIFFGKDGVFDEVFGFDGNDTIGGGNGADKLIGGSGTDLVDYSESLLAVQVDLASNAVSGGHAQGDEIGGFEGVYGGQGGDTLKGNVGSNTIWGLTGNDVIDGRGGTDHIYGGTGRDTLTGGGGGDRFHFLSGESNPGAANRDIVTDFSKAQGDKLDVSSMGDFDFIGTSSFSAIDQVRYFQSGGHTIVEVNTDSDVLAEMQIDLVGNINLAQSDFLLRRPGPPAAHRNGSP